MIKKSFLILLALATSPLLAGEAPDYSPDEVLVCFRSPLSMSSQGISAGAFSQLPAYHRNLLNSAGASFVKPLYPEELISKARSDASSISSRQISAYRDELDRQERTFLVKLEEGTSVESAVQRLKKDAAVEYCEPNFRRRIFRTPNDAFYAADLWGLNNTGQSAGQDPFDVYAGSPGRDIAAPLAWDTTTGASNVIVAVIDAGISYSHTDLSANMISGYDDGDGDSDPNDDCSNSIPALNANGHGTHVSGIVGMVGNNSTGGTGAAWTVSIMPLKVARTRDCLMFDDNIALAIQRARNNKNGRPMVINMSLGGPDSSLSLQSQVNSALAAGIVVVAAAGNEGDQTLQYPAAYPGVISVAATHRNDFKASFSTYGSWIVLSAPGVAIKSTLPGNTYGFKSGTSMASPLVAGVAALVLSQYPTLTVSEVTSRLTASCESLNGVNPGYSGLLGAGRVHAARALMSVTGVSPSAASLESAVSLTVSGVSFVPGATVQLSKVGSSTITATNVTFNSATSLSCTVNLSGAATGQWNVVVSTGRMTQTLSNGFTVEGLSLRSVTPGKGSNSSSSVQVSLGGFNFSSGMSVKLARSGESDITGTNVNVVSVSSASATFNLSGARGGRWNVVVTASNVSSTLTEGFVVTSSVFDRVNPDASQNNTYTLSPNPGTVTVSWPAGIGSFDYLDLDAAPNLPAIDRNKDPYVTTNIGIEILASPSATALSKSFQLTLPYRLSDLPDASDEAGLTLATYNTTTRRWEPIRSTVDRSARTVTASISHLSVFALLQHIPSDNLDGVIAFPNPFRSDKGHLDVTFDFLSDGAKVKIYDVSGELIRELSDDNEDGRILWPLTNESGQPVASGVYIYRVTDGEGRKKMGRVGVVR